MQLLRSLIAGLIGILVFFAPAAYASATTERFVDTFVSGTFTCVEDPTVTVTVFSSGSTKILNPPQSGGPTTSPFTSIEVEQTNGVHAFIDPPYLGATIAANLSTATVSGTSTFSRVSSPGGILDGSVSFTFKATSEPKVASFNSVQQFDGLIIEGHFTGIQRTAAATGTLTLTEEDGTKVLSCTLVSTSQGAISTVIQRNSSGHLTVTTF